MIDAGDGEDAFVGGYAGLEAATLSAWVPSLLSLPVSLLAPAEVGRSVSDYRIGGSIGQVVFRLGDMR